MAPAPLERAGVAVGHRAGQCPVLPSPHPGASPRAGFQQYEFTERVPLIPALSWGLCSAAGPGCSFSCPAPRCCFPGKLFLNKPQTYCLSRSQGTNLPEDKCKKLSGDKLSNSVIKYKCTSGTF